MTGASRIVRVAVLVTGAVSAIFGLAATAAADTLIDLTYDSVMDMVRPEVHPGIAVHHNLQITLAGGGSLAEAQRRALSRSKRHGPGSG